MAIIRSKSAFSLIELMISMAILVFAVFAAWAFIQNSNRSWEHIVDDTEMMNALRRSQQDIHEHLIQAFSGGLSIDNTTSPNWDSISFQIPLSLSAGGATWGADNQAGWRYRYEVKNADGRNNLYRITYDGGNVEKNRVHLLRGVPSFDGTTRGIDFTLANGGVISVIRAERKIATQQGTLTRQLTFRTGMRN